MLQVKSAAVRHFFPTFCEENAASRLDSPSKLATLLGSLSKSSQEKKLRSSLDAVEMLIILVTVLTKVKERLPMDTYTLQRIRLLQFVATHRSYRPGLILEVVA